MKVTLLKSRLNHRGGLEKYTFRLATAFAARGDEVTILTTGETPQCDNVHTISLGKDSKLSFYHVWRFNKVCQKWLAAHPQDIVFGMERTTHQTHYRAGSGVHAAFLKQRMLTDSPFKRLSFFLNPLHRLILHYEKKTFESPDLRRLFTNSERVKHEILTYYATDPAKIFVVYNGVEWQEWERDFALSIERMRPAPYHFLFVGNDYRRKGLEFLMRGLALLDSPYHLTIVGKEKHLHKFKSLAKSLQIAQYVSLAGPQSDLRPFYSQADALVIPSIYDPFSNVTLEALSMGLFVVSSSFNGGSEILTHSSGTIIEELSSPTSVASALKIALAHPKTAESALKIRGGIKDLDFSNQLDKIIRQCIL